VSSSRKFTTSAGVPPIVQTNRPEFAAFRALVPFAERLVAASREPPEASLTMKRTGRCDRPDLL